MMTQLQHRAISALVLSIVFSITPLIIQKTEYYYMANKLNKTLPEEIVVLNKFSATFSGSSIVTTLSREVRQPISVERKIQIFKQETGYNYLVAESKKLDSFTIQPSSSTFKKRFDFYDLKFYSDITSGNYLIQEGWSFDVGYDVHKTIEFEHTISIN